jgi:hypothetical protein
VALDGGRDMKKGREKWGSVKYRGSNMKCERQTKCKNVKYIQKGENEVKICMSGVYWEKGQI